MFNRKPVNCHEASPRLPFRAYGLHQKVKQMNKRIVLMGAVLLLTAATAFAQHPVTGRVTDSHGQPVVGASVRVAGTKVRTVTDANGNFTLPDVPANARQIQVSYIGMNTTTVNVAGNVQVVMSDNELGEAVVVGYGTARKLGTVVGSVTTVGGEVMVDKPVVNVIDALQGQVAGLNILNSSGDPGAAITSEGYSASIRGIGSLSAGSTPLFIVDGVPTSSSVLGMMNPNDIENVTVLKGASATSIYGSRASNGVIYITTKKGSLHEKARVTVGQTIGWSGLARRLGNPLSANELLELQREYGLISGADYIAAKQEGVNTDWQDYNFRSNAATYQTNVSIQGGNERTSYFTSASYMKQDGITAASSFERITFRTNLESKPKDWLTYGVNLSVSYDDRRASDVTFNGSNYINGGSLQGIIASPLWNPYDENGNKADKYDTQQGIFYSTEYMASKNPLFTNDLRSVSSGFINISPVKGLNLRSQLSVDALATRSTRKLYPSYEVAAGVGSVSESYSRSAVFTITNTAEYKFSIGNVHNFTLLAGQEGIKGTSETLSANTTGQVNDRITTLGNGLEINSLPSSSESEYQYLSFFGRADYGYADKYFLNFSVRNDQCSRFGSNGKSAMFYSGGAMWDIKREPFLADVKWLDELQIRADVGSTGNSSINNYAHLELAGNTQYGGNYGYTYASTGNVDLKWEKQVQTSVGFSARLFDRLDLTFSWYDRVSKDMLLDVPIAYSTGFSSKPENVASMSNRGIEVEFKVDVLKGRGWFLSLRGNYSYNKNKITKLFRGLDEWFYSGTGIIYIKDEAVQFYMPIFAGVDKETGEQMWYKEGCKGDVVYEYDPETMTKDFDEAPLQATGKKRFAPHNGGFGLTAHWKGLTLSADFNFTLGKYLVNNDRYFSDNPYLFMSSYYNQDKAVLNMWRNPGDLTQEPRYGETRQFDTHLLENASFMRMKNLTLSYDLPQAWMQATRFFDNVRLSFTARNLFTVTKYSGNDPEIDSYNALGAYPNTRQYSIGVEVSF